MASSPEIIQEIKKDPQYKSMRLLLVSSVQKIKKLNTAQEIATFQNIINGASQFDIVLKDYLDAHFSNITEQKMPEEFKKFEEDALKKEQSLKEALAKTQPTKK
jgi:hypothetical protein